VVLGDDLDLARGKLQDHAGDRDKIVLVGVDHRSIPGRAAVEAEAQRDGVLTDRQLEVPDVQPDVVSGGPGLAERRSARVAQRHAIVRDRRDHAVNFAREEIRVRG